MNYEILYTLEELLHEFIVYYHDKNNKSIVKNYDDLNNNLLNISKDNNKIFKNLPKPENKSCDLEKIINKIENLPFVSELKKNL
ncbi:MAG: hypothetical protein LBJ93_00485 [Clostridiales bacterium]|jgi:hypothetical protein|nr:hypothetical protein [Clostridiales bacterium]